MAGNRRAAAFIGAGMVVALMLLGTAARPSTGPNLSVPLHPIASAGPRAGWVPSPTSQAVPIPKGSVRTLATVPDGTNPTPATNDLLVGHVSYVVPVGSAQVAEWYGAAFARMGWRQMGSGSYVQEQRGTVSQMVSFSPSLADNLLTVYVLWASDGRGKSLVEYWITEIVLPPKPASAILPRDIVKVVAHPVYAPGRSGITRTVTDAAWIARLVTRVNALSTSPGGVNLGCSPYGGVGLTLYTARGRAIHVTAYCYTVTVGGTGLTDTNFLVEKMVEALFPPSMFGS